MEYGLYTSYKSNHNATATRSSSEDQVVRQVKAVFLPEVRAVPVHTSNRTSLEAKGLSSLQ